MTVLKLSVRGIRKSMGRLLLTILAISLGVGFVSGSFIISDSLGKVFNDIVLSANANLDARIQPITDLSFGQQPGVIPETLLGELAELDEVAEVEGFVAAVEPNIIVGLGPDGEPRAPQGPPILTFSWSGPNEEGGFELVDGSPPVGPDEVAINVEQAEELELAAGDTGTFQTPTGLQELTVSGIVSFPGGGAWFTLFDLPTAQLLLDKQGELDAVAVTAAPSVLPSEVLSAVEPLLPGGVEVIDQEQATADDSEQFTQIIDILGNVLLGFALVALFVSLFIIYNTFAILVSQRVQEIGMLRAIGATQGQIRLIILIEAVMVGVVGSAVGIVTGIGVAALIKALFESQGGFPETETVVSATTIIVSLVVGLIATLVSALLPAFKAGRISPVEAIRAEGVTEHRGVIRIVMGAVVTIVGLVGVGIGLTGQGGVAGTLALLGFGAMFTFIGVALLSGLFAGPVVNVLGRSGIVSVLGTISGILLFVGGLVLVLGSLQALVFASGAIGEIQPPGGGDPITPPTGASRYLIVILGGAFGLLGVLFLFSAPRAIIDGVRLLRDAIRGGSERKMVRIARQNAARSPQRTAATATALMIGLALVTLVSVLGQSLRVSLSNVLSESLGADLFIATEFGTALPDEFAERLVGLEGIDAASEYRAADIRIGGEDGDVYGIEGFTASVENAIIDYDLTEGSFDGLTDGRSVLVVESLATEQGWTVGEELAVEFEDRQIETLRIGGLVGNENFVEGSFLVDSSVFVEHNPDVALTSIGATIDEDADIEAVTESARRLATEYPSVEVFNNDDLQQELESGINGILVLINGLLGLALVVAFFGVVNTIVLSVLERTKEIGLLRAVGMTREQLMSTIRWEAVMVSLFGTLLGIALGILFGIAGVRAVPDNVISEVAIPWLTLAVIVVMAGLIGVLAAYLPARRAANLNPLDAIHTL